MKIITDEQCVRYGNPGHPERPERLLMTWEKLRNLTAIPINWDQPAPVSDASLLRAHTREHLARLNIARDFDADTAFFPNIADRAKASVGAGLRALKLARGGETGFSLMRPPGHHATSSQAMGFCYLNSIAVTVLEALATGAKRVAVYDFDVHHGNGTEEILLNKPHVTFHSIHQFPCYPGTGSRNVGDNCYNYPVPPQLPRAEYRKV